VEKERIRAAELNVRASEKKKLSWRDVYPSVTSSERISVKFFSPDIRREYLNKDISEAVNTVKALIRSK